MAALAAPPWPLAPQGDERAQRRALHHLGAALYRDLALLHGAATGADMAPLLRLADKWEPVSFPIKGRDLTALGVPPGRQLGRLLAQLEAWWEAGDFRADRDACLAELRARVEGK